MSVNFTTLCGAPIPLPYLLKCTIDCDECDMVELDVLVELCGSVMKNDTVLRVATVTMTMSGTSSLLMINSPLSRHSAYGRCLWDFGDNLPYA
jgi:hypothetical protein